jgi:hypothetical protein
MSYDDELLMAYADGELDEARRSEISAAIAKDPELARRVESHRAFRVQLSGAFAEVLEQPVPGSLEAAARGARAGAGPLPKIVAFSAKSGRAPAPPWRSREWFALAASLLLGAFLSWRFLMPSASQDVIAVDGSLVAGGALATALDSQLASEQVDDATVLIGLTFRAHDGSHCRSFVSHAPAIAGLACHKEDRWHLVVTQSVDLQSGPMRQAAAMPPGILMEIEKRLDGEPFDAAGEKAARDASWPAR